MVNTRKDKKMDYEKMIYTPKHDDCDECIVCLVRAHEMLKHTVADTIATFSEDGDHCGSISR
jgi:hypothetical protein